MKADYVMNKNLIGTLYERIIERCLRVNPDERPSTKKLLEMVGTIRSTFDKFNGDVEKAEAYLH